MTTPATTLDWALFYADKGIPVFPCNQHKQPFKDTSGFKDATTDPDEIKRMWKRFPRATAIGAPCGKVFDVVDVDSDGIAELSKRRYSKSKPRAKTASGGFHLFVKPGTIKMGVGNIAKGIDGRGEGSYVIMPGSQCEHKVTGDLKGYEWLTEPDWETLEFPEPPEWCIPAPVASNGAFHLPEVIHEGEGRNNAAYKAYASYLAKGLTHELAEGSVRFWNDRSCKPPIDERELSIIFGSARKLPVGLSPEYEARRKASIAERQAEGFEAETPEDMASIAFAGELDRANAFAAESQGILRFCPDRATWLTMVGRDIWDESPGGDGSAIHLASLFHARASRAAKEIAKGLVHSEDKKDVAIAASAEKAAKAVLTRTSIQNTVGLARTVPGLQVRTKQMDMDPYLVGTLSGALDLRTGRIVDAPEDMITRYCPVEYDPDAKCPEFERFLSEVYRESGPIIRLVKAALGYSLSGLTCEHSAIIILYGKRARNGKSTLFKTMKHLMGRYCAPIDKRLLTLDTNDAARFSLANLEGVRMATASEVGHKALDTEFLKALTGEDMMTAERKGIQGYEFRPCSKLFLATNTLPFARFDNAFRSRIIAIPHLQSFYAWNDPSCVDGDKEPRDGLEGALYAEAPGILAMLARAFREIYMEEGLRKPPEVLELAHQYEMANDYVSLFLAECCERDEDARIGSNDLFVAYSAFCKRMKFPQPGRSNEFSDRMEQEEGITKIMPGNRRTYIGIRLASQTQEENYYWNK